MTDDARLLPLLAQQAEEIVLLKRTLKDICEEFYGDACDPACDSIAHTETCRHIWARAQFHAQAEEIARLRAALAAAPDMTCESPEARAWRAKHVAPTEP